MMESVNRAEFNKRVYGKGRFKQFIIAPYASEERNIYSKVVITSDKVKAPTWMTHRRRKLALILPEGIDVFAENIGLLTEWTGVEATYFGVFDLEDDRLLFTVRGGERV